MDHIQILYFDLPYILILESLTHYVMKFQTFLFTFSKMSDPEQGPDLGLNCLQNYGIDSRQNKSV